MNGIRLATLYLTFAALATAVNISTQWVVVRAWPWSVTAVAAGIAAGTLTGLLVKYLLDKRWIFRFVTRDTRHDTHTFAMYTLMGGVTTVIFWGSELAFHHIFGSETMRYVGAVIGLAIGYVSKYQLDKRFVFVNRRTSNNA
jgi:putative flippase GtrA